MMATGVTAPVSAGPTDNKFFYEDEVFRIDQYGRIKFGLVLENEAYSTDEEDEYEETLSKGEVRIAWHPDGKEDVVTEHSVGLADRTLMPGDVVRRLVPGKDTQRGYCREINMRADVKVVGTKYVVKNVMAERLRPLLNVPRDNAVCLDSWVGSTKCVNEKIVLRSSCGAVLEVPDVDISLLKDKNTRLRDGLFSDTVFYPGQVVTGRLESMENVKMLTPSISLKTNKKGKIMDRKFIVQSVQIDSVWVHWQCKALSENGADVKAAVLQHPKPYVTGEDLKRLKFLNLFESCMLQINDKNYLKITDCDVILKKSQWEKEQGVKYKVLYGQQQKDDRQNYRNKAAKLGAKNSADKIKIKLTHSDLLEVESKRQLLSKSLSKLNNTSNGSPRKCVSLTGSTLGAGGGSAVLSTENTEKINNESVEMKIDGQTESNDPVKIIHPPIIKFKETIAEQLNQEKDLNLSADDWLTDEDCDDIDENEETSVSESTATISTCSSPTPRSSPKCSPLLHKKQIRKYKRKIANALAEKMPVVGEQVVTEALLVYSTANVVWQDGTIETGIASTQLYPIHHLDDHEFFPGDFVLSGVEGSENAYRDYGVIQTVDHHGRTAHVKWFTAYTSVDEPRPTFAGDAEVSVYDLKDHPDFQYRPGTIVIRVANFVGEDATCTAGQIVDNYIDGRVKVWWVDGHIGMCWPQDLFEVGQYDADSNFLGNNDSDNESWETESESSEVGCTPSKDSSETPQLGTNLERARVAMSRLEEIFNINPSLQNQEVMRKLLAVYKKCRYLDRLMNTSYFHEDHFMGLLERVRAAGGITKSECAQDQKNNLLTQSPISKQKQTGSGKNDICIAGQPNQIMETASKVGSPRDYSPKVIVNLSSTPFKYSSIKKKSNKLELSSGNLVDSASNNPSISVDKSCTTYENYNNVNNTNNSTNSKEMLALASVGASAAGGCTPSVIVNATKVASQQQPIIFYETNLNSDSPADPKNLYTHEKNKLLTSVMSHIEKATQETEKSNQLKLNATLGSVSQDDSGTFSRTNDLCDGSSTSYASSTDLTNDANMSLLRATDDQKSVSCSSFELIDDSSDFVCVRLCGLLKQQLLKALQEIQQKYCKKNLNLSEVIEFSCSEENENENEMKIGDNSETDKENTNKGENRSNSSNSEHEKDLQMGDSLPGTDISGQTTPTDERNDQSLESPCSVFNKVPVDNFQVLDSAPTSHKFHLTVFQPANPKQYYKAVNKEHKLLRSSLPPGVCVRVFEDRMDLISVMIKGPTKTPYEGGMFFFEIQLGRDYPKTPPLCHYLSYCSDRLNPNLYEDGKVCVSLLGTWSGRDSEIWGPNSTLLQVIVSIQGLILVAEPYYNEAGYEKQKGTQQGVENSRMYNEMVVIKLVQSMTKLISSPPDVFREQISRHFLECGKSMHARIKNWMELSKQHNSTDASTTKEVQLDDDNEKKAIILPPEFPLIPASRGFCLTLAGLLDNFERKIETIPPNDTAVNNEKPNLE